MKLKRSITLLLFALIAAVLPLTAFAADGQNPTAFTLTLECKINDVVPTNTYFVFEVTSADIKDEANITNETKLDDFTVSTKTNTDGKASYNFGTETPANKYFSFKLKSCSDKLAVISTKKVEVRFFAETVKVSIWENDTEKENYIYPDDEIPPFTVNLSRLPEVKISTEGCETITKTYDGTLSANVTDKNYKLTGVQEGHDVKLSFSKAEYDKADVKNASKVILSGLKLTGNDAAKYGLASDKVELKASVTPRPITVTADDAVSTIGASDPQLTFKLSEELIAGNKVTGELTRAPGNSIGEYDITIGSLSLGDNYTVTFVEGKLKISSFGFFQVLDRSTSVKVAGYFSNDSTVTAAALDPNSDVYGILSASASWGQIISAYDVKFTNTGHDGNLTVYLPVESQYEGKQITVYQQMSQSAIMCYKATVSGGYAAVETDECTQFMLVTEKAAAEEGEESSSVAWTVFKIILIILAVIVGLALVIVLFFFAMIFFNKTEQLKKIIKSIKQLLKK